MKDSETCLAEYIYDRIVKGDYVLEYREDHEASIYLKRSWWRTDKVYMRKVSCKGMQSYFKFRDVAVYSDLVVKALELINTRQDEINRQNRLRNLATLVEDLKLECNDKN